MCTVSPGADSSVQPSGGGTYNREVTENRNGALPVSGSTHPPWVPRALREPNSQPGPPPPVRRVLPPLLPVPPPIAARSSRCPVALPPPQPGPPGAFPPPRAQAGLPGAPRAARSRRCPVFRRFRRSRPALRSLSPKRPRGSPVPGASRSAPVPPLPPGGSRWFPAVAPGLRFRFRSRRRGRAAAAAAAAVPGAAARRGTAWPGWRRRNDRAPAPGPPPQLLPRPGTAPAPTAAPGRAPEAAPGTGGCSGPAAVSVPGATRVPALRGDSGRYLRLPLPGDRPGSFGPRRAGAPGEGQRRRVRAGSGTGDPSRAPVGDSPGVPGPPVPAGGSTARGNRHPPGPGSPSRIQNPSPAPRGFRSFLPLALQQLFQPRLCGTREAESRARTGGARLEPGTFPGTGQSWEHRESPPVSAGAAWIPRSVSAGMALVCHRSPVQLRDGDGVERRVQLPDDGIGTPAPPAHPHTSLGCREVGKPGWRLGPGR